MTAILVASFALGFFAAGLLPVFWLIAVAGMVALAALIAAASQGMAILHAIGLGAASFALAQVGYGFGLYRVAALRKRCVPD